MVALFFSMSAETHSNRYTPLKSMHYSSGEHANHAESPRADWHSDCFSLPVPTTLTFNPATMDWLNFSLMLFSGILFFWMFLQLTEAAEKL